MQFQVFPRLATVTPGMGLLRRALRIALPALTLTLVVVAHMMRMTRAAMLNVHGQPLYRDGAPQGHAAAPHHRCATRCRTRSAPIINVIALNLAYLVVGVVVVEVVFVYPGIGQFMVDAVSKRDVPVVQACGLIFAVSLHPPQPDWRTSLGIVSQPAPAASAMRTAATAAATRHWRGQDRPRRSSSLNLLAALSRPGSRPTARCDRSCGDVWAPIRSASILLGTDQLGRDMLSRLIYGARNTIGIALVTTLLSFAIGIDAGLLGGGGAAAGSTSS